jgi:hypothetical protein
MVPFPFFSRPCQKQIFECDVFNKKVTGLKDDCLFAAQVENAVELLGFWTLYIDWTMDKVQNLSNSGCYTKSSESFRSYNIAVRTTRNRQILLKKSEPANETFQIIKKAYGEDALCRSAAFK